MSGKAQAQPVVSGSAVMAAGFASTLAAVITSKFGVAGTILGAGITAMIVTGGSAILRAYLESAAGKVREMPSRIRTGAQGARDMARFGGGAQKSSFLGRFSRALGWFTRLPALNRSSILKRGLIGALAAFVVGIAFISFTEFAIGNSLACGLWGRCPEGATPGVHLGADRAAGARFSLAGNRSKAGNVPATQQNASPIRRLIPGSGSDQPGVQPVVPQGGGANQQQATPTAEPAQTAEPKATSTAQPKAAPTAEPQAAPTAEPKATSTAQPKGAAGQ